MNIRRRSLTDSLQLLVDTICNLFGSVVIISLLVALLSHDTSFQTNATDQIANRQRELNQARAELEEARRLEATLTNRPFEASERLALAAERDELARRLAAEQAALESNSVSALALNVEEASIPDALLKRKTKLASDVEALARQVERARQGRQRLLRLPRERATGKKTCYFILQYGKIYPVYIFHQGTRERNNQTLGWNQTADGDSPAPQREGGIDVGNLAGFARLFSEIPAQTYSIHFLVYNDSFPTFLAARQIPLQRGYDTGWEFLPEDRAINFSARGEAPPAL